MKRSTLFSVIMLLAILACFFSSTVYAGGGNVTGDLVDPWDADGIVTDSLDGLKLTYIQSDLSGGSNTFSFLSYSLTTRFTIWFLNENFIVPQKKQIKEVSIKRNDFRGSYRSK